MAVKLPEGWYDISVPIKQGMVYTPYDPAPPKIYRYHDPRLGGPVTMAMLEIILHTGTHIDTPLHFIPNGSSVSDMPIEATVGPAKVIEISDPKTIKAGELKKHSIQKGDRVLFKTKNSPSAYEGLKFPDEYVYFDFDAADYLKDKGVVLVGLDCITVGNFKDPESIGRIHNTFLNAGIYILENCAMAGVPEGEYELMCLPLLVYGGDAGPCRAILRPLKK